MSEVVECVITEHVGFDYYPKDEPQFRWGITFVYEMDGLNRRTVRYGETKEELDLKYAVGKSQLFFKPTHNLS